MAEICCALGTDYSTITNSHGRIQARFFFTSGVLAKVQRRMALRAHWLNRALLKNRHTLFVRFGGHFDDLPIWPYTLDPRPISGADFQRLTDAIDTSFPGLPYMIAFAYHPEFTTFDPAGLPDRVIPHAFPEIGIDHLKPEDKWRGDDANWDGLFRRLEGLRLEAAA